MDYLPPAVVVSREDILTQQEKVEIQVLLILGLGLRLEGLIYALDSWELGLKFSREETCIMRLWAEVEMQSVTCTKLTQPHFLLACSH